MQHERSRNRQFLDRTGRVLPCGALFGGRRIRACVAVEIRRVADNVIHTAVRQQRTHLPEVALQSGYVFQLVCRDGLPEQVERAVLQFQSGNLEVGPPYEQRQSACAAAEVEQFGIASRLGERAEQHAVLSELKKTIIL